MFKSLKYVKLRIGHKNLWLINNRHNGLEINLPEPLLANFSNAGRTNSISKTSFRQGEVYKPKAILESPLEKPKNRIQTNCIGPWFNAGYFYVCIGLGFLSNWIPWGGGSPFGHSIDRMAMHLQCIRTAQLKPIFGGAGRKHAEKFQVLGVYLSEVFPSGVCSISMIVDLRYRVNYKIS